MITKSGKRVFPRNDPRFCDEYPTLEDIALGLSRQSRFAGQVDYFYSVFCHVEVASGLSDDFALDLLLHDAGEAVISDVPTTWKPDTLKSMEKDLIKGVYESLGLTPPPFPKFKQDEIDKVDFALLVAEAHELGHAAAEEFWPLGSYSDNVNELIDMAIERTREMVFSGHSLFYLMNTDEAVDRFQYLYDLYL